MTAVLRFPVICINDRVIRLYRILEEMNLATSPALKNVWFENQLVIDAAGNGYVVERAEKDPEHGKAFL